MTRDFLELSELLELLELLDSYKKTISRNREFQKFHSPKVPKVPFFNPFEVPLKAGRRTFFFQKLSAAVLVECLFRQGAIAGKLPLLAFKEQQLVLLPLHLQYHHLFHH